MRRASFVLGLLLTVFSAACAHTGKTVHTPTPPGPVAPVTVAPEEKPFVVLTGDSVAGLVLTFPAGQAWGCVVWQSQANPDYTPGKCGPIPDDATSVLIDWSMINCTMGGPAYCPDDDWWLVKGFVQKDTGPSGPDQDPAYSNTLKIRFVKVEPAQ